MARPVASDFLQAFRFHVQASGTPLGDKFLTAANIQSGNVQAGFSAVNTPSGTIDAAEYREGQYIYTRKYPGIPTMDDVTLSRGVVLTDTEFFFWYRTCVEGVGEYRADLIINHYHRTAVGVTGRPTGIVGEPEGLNLDSSDHKTYVLFNAFPIGHKTSSDLDGTASEVAISDLTVSYERFDVGTPQ